MSVFAGGECVQYNFGDALRQVVLQISNSLNKFLTVRVQIKKRINLDAAAVAA